MLKGKPHILQGLHPVVQIVDLTSPGDLLKNCFSYSLHAVGLDKSLYRPAVAGRCLQHRKVSYFKERHVECPWNRCRREGKTVYGGLELLHLLLVLDTEPLLLVHHHES